jgi:hypothetical protein
MKNIKLYHVLEIHGRACGVNFVLMNYTGFIKKVMSESKVD